MPRRPGVGVLPLVAGMLCASALLRLGSDTFQVFAADGPAVEAEVEATPGCAPTGSTEEVLAAFRDREARLTERETALADRQQALDLAEAEITEKLAALQEAEAALSATMARAETAAEEDLSRLTLVYENMKPADAAALFTEMDPAFSAGFLGLMRPEAAAAILSNLEPTVAYTISAILAGRNANAPTQ